MNARALTLVPGLICGLVAVGCGSDSTSDSSADAELSTECPVTHFTPCGGDVTGTWAIRSFCPEDAEAAAELFEHPYDDRPECQGPGNPVDGVATTVGSISFDHDGRVSIASSSGYSLSYGFSDACLGVVQRDGSPEEACLAMESNGRLECEYEPNACTCAGQLDSPEVVETGNYVIDGDQITLNDEQLAWYCRDGDVLILDFIMHPTSWRYWILEAE